MNKSCGCSRFQGAMNNSKNCNVQHKNDCCCVDTMAKQLKKMEGQLVAVFEKDYIALGFVEKVINKEVLVLSPVVKVIVSTLLPIPLPLGKAYISICDIIEFATVPALGMSAADQLAELVSSLQVAE